MASISLPAPVAPTDTLARFLNYLTIEKGLSPLTLAAYRADLMQLRQFLGVKSSASSQ